MPLLHCSPVPFSPSSEDSEPSPSDVSGDTDTKLRLLIAAGGVDAIFSYKLVRRILGFQAQTETEALLLVRRTFEVRFTQGKPHGVQRVSQLQHGDRA